MRVMRAMVYFQHYNFLDEAKQKFTSFLKVYA